MSAVGERGAVAAGAAGGGGAACAISAVVPAYNEEDSLEAGVRLLLPQLEAIAPGSCEVIVVDDGSTDATAAILGRIAADPRVRGVRLARNRGKGAALRAGVAASRGELVLICDADMATPPEQLLDLVAALRAGADVVIGSRRLPGSEILRAQPPLRVALGIVHTRLANLLFRTSVTDFTCGFKLFRGGVARRLFAQCRSDRWAYDVEVIAAALREGLRLKEVPVRWRDGRRTKVRIPHAVVSTLAELLRARFLLPAKGRAGDRKRSPGGGGGGA